MNILIAEDDDISRDLLRRILEPEPDCTLAFAEDGEKAWALLTEGNQHFDIGIFDLMMPRLSGLDLVERIRATPALKALPIILCTAVKDRATVQRASLLAISHYVVKPYTRARILEKVTLVRAQLPKNTGTENSRGVANRLGVDAATVAELLKNLLGKVEKWLATAKESRTVLDFKRDAQDAHALMGACLSLGAQGLHRELEKVATVLVENFAAPNRAPAVPMPEEIADKLAPVATEVARIKTGLKPSGSVAPAVPAAPVAPAAAAAPAAPAAPVEVAPTA